MRGVCSNLRWMPLPPNMRKPVYTIGHSNRSAPELLRLLQENGIHLLADVRAVPRSRFNPQFNREVLAKELGAVGIAYRHLPELGGKRAPSPNSPNTTFRADGGLQSYADYMATPAFQDALDVLLALDGTTAVMCAEAKPENCHRQLIADALLVRHVPVVHILGPGQTRTHALHKAAVATDGRLTYPGPEPTFL